MEETWRCVIRIEEQNITAMKPRCKTVTAHQYFFVGPYLVELDLMILAALIVGAAVNSKNFRDNLNISENYLSKNSLLTAWFNFRFNSL